MGKKRDISAEKKIEIWNYLLSISEGEDLPRGSRASVAQKFDVSHSTIRNIWNKGPGNSRGKTRRKMKWTDELVTSHIKNVEWRYRSNLRVLSHVSGVPKTILFGKIQKGLLTPCTNRITPALSERHKQLRMNFVVKSLAQKNDLGHYFFF